MSDLKILVCGDVNGNFKSLFSKVDLICRKKGSFEYLFCVGNFFGSNASEWEDLKSGKITVPLATYILGANEFSHKQFYSSIDLIPNIVYLGEKGCFTTSSGLKVVYLSGIEQPGSKEHISSNKVRESYSNKGSANSIFFCKEDVNDLIKNVESESVIDILITSQWPKGVTKYAVSIDKNESSASGLISSLAKVLKPRYHFCGLSGIHYERIPYRNHEVLQESPMHVTRFVALAPVNNTQRHKWLYAFNITPANCLSQKQLIDTSGPATACPYDLTESLNLDKFQNQFFYESSTYHHSQKHSRQHPDQHPSQSKKQCTIDSSKCWFCLSNADVEKQLIISIGSHCYITLAKGILVPEHVLIVPINHAVSSAELPPPVSGEVEKFKKSLVTYFHDKDRDVVFFERNYCSPHLQIQAVPVPKQIKALIQRALFAFARQYNLEFTELPNSSSINQVVPHKKPYFYFELVINKKTEAKYIHIISEKFPLQFGRTVLASSEVLNVTDRIDWRECQDTKSTEEEMAENMRKSFGPYDLT